MCINRTNIAQCNNDTHNHKLKATEAFRPSRSISNIKGNPIQFTKADKTHTKQIPSTECTIKDGHRKTQPWKLYWDRNNRQRAASLWPREEGITTFGTLSHTWINKV